ncbi:MAG: hypothetical protein ABSF25_26810 [Bryobacteraceae bacterium]
MEYTPRIDFGNIGELARSYTADQSEEDRKAEARIEEEVGPTARENGYYTKAHFLELCRWKTPRSRPRCTANDEEYIRDVTALALATKNERLRIEVLTLLDGVGWPTASVLLHFGHWERYPILDFRALWSLSIPEPQGEYKFSFWWDYVQICREIAEKCGVTMRTLDRALWQFSSVHQR